MAERDILSGAELIRVCNRVMQRQKSGAEKAMQQPPLCTYVCLLRSLGLFGYSGISSSKWQWLWLLQ